MAGVGAKAFFFPIQKPLHIAEAHVFDDDTRRLSIVIKQP
jgi:hypothetical protein